MKTRHPFLDYNGAIQSGPLAVSEVNRALQYGDGVFETMRFHEGEILFANDHFERLNKGLEALRIKFPAGFSMQKFNKHIKKLLVLNKIQHDARIRLQVTRNDGGFYRPLTGESTYMLTVSNLENECFVLNEKGLKIDTCNSVVLPVNLFSNHKTCNGLPYVMAGVFATENKLDDCLLLNSNGKIAEAGSSNVFMVKRGNIFTPPLSDGCVAGVMRKNIIRLSSELNFGIKEKSLLIKDLLAADEIFLTNVTHGIRWVESFRNKKKKNELTAILNWELGNSLSFH